MVHLLSSQYLAVLGAVTAALLMFLIESEIGGALILAIIAWAERPSSSDTEEVGAPDALDREEWRKAHAEVDELIEKIHKL